MITGKLDIVNGISYIKIMKITEKELIWAIKRSTSIAQIARFYDVSRQCMHEKITIAGLMPVWKKRAQSPAVKKAIKERCSAAGRAGVGMCKSRAKRPGFAGPVD